MSRLQYRISEVGGLSHSWGGAGILGYARNMSMNLMDRRHSALFADWSAATDGRLSVHDIASSPWAWVAIFFLDDFIILLVPSHQPRVRFWWAAHVNHHPRRIQSVDGSASIMDQRVCGT